MTAQPTVRLRLTAATKADDQWAESAPDEEARDRLEAAIAAALSDLASRWVDRALTRIESPKQRKGTRHWVPEYDEDTRVGTKALDAPRAVDEDGMPEDAQSATEPVITPAAVAAALALYVALNEEEEPPDRPSLLALVADAVGSVLALVASSASRQAALLVNLILGLDDSGSDMPTIRAALLAHYPAMQEWARGLAVQAATATIEGAREAAAVDLAHSPSLDLDVMRRWRSRRDERVRHTHSVEEGGADGQEQPIGTPFVVGGALLMFPGDPRAPFRETANCRCWLLWRSKRSGRFVPKLAEAKARYGADGLTHTGHILVRVGGQSYVWKPDDHPRDRHGKFISKGGIVRTAAGDLAKVDNVIDANRIEVTDAAGNTSVVSRRSVEVTEAPDGGAPTGDVRQVAEEVAHDPAHPEMPAHTDPAAPDTHASTASEMTSRPVEPTVTGSLVHYGTPTVNVEPYRAQDDRGYEVEVDRFTGNGPTAVVAEGLRVRNDGTTADRRQVAQVAIPQNVRDAIAALRSPPQEPAAPETPKPYRWRRHSRGLVSDDGNYWIEPQVRGGNLYRRASEADYNSEQAVQADMMSTDPPFEYGFYIASDTMTALRGVAEDDRQDATFYEPEPAVPEVTPAPPMDPIPATVLGSPEERADTYVDEHLIPMLRDTLGRLRAADPQTLLDESGPYAALVWRQQRGYKLDRTDQMAVDLASDDPAVARRARTAMVRRWRKIERGRGQARPEFTAQVQDAVNEAHRNPLIAGFAADHPIRVHTAVLDRPGSQYPPQASQDRVTHRITFYDHDAEGGGGIETLRPGDVTVDDLRGGRQPATASGGKAIAVYRHEFGHHVEAALGDSDPRIAEFRSLWRTYRDEYDAAFEGATTYEERQAVMDQQLTYYSLENATEGWAEAWTMVTTPGFTLDMIDYRYTDTARALLGLAWEVSHDTDRESGRDGAGDGAAGARAPAGAVGEARGAAGAVRVEEGTPLDYRGMFRGKPYRFSIEDDTAEPLTERDLSQGNWEGATPQTVAYLDVYDDGQYAYVAFMTTRRSHVRQGLAKQMMTAAYARFPDARFVWGDIMHDDAEGLYHSFRDAEPERTTGARNLRGVDPRAEADAPAVPVERQPIAWRRHLDGNVSEDGNYYIERRITGSNLYARAEQGSPDAVAITDGPFPYGRLVDSGSFTALRLRAEEEAARPAPEPAAAIPATRTTAYRAEILATPKLGLGKDDLLGAATLGAESVRSSSARVMPGGVVSIIVTYDAADEDAARATLRGMTREVMSASATAPEASMRPAGRRRDTSAPDTVGVGYGQDQPIQTPEGGTDDGTLGDTGRGQLADERTQGVPLAQGQGGVLRGAGSGSPAADRRGDGREPGPGGGDVPPAGDAPASGAPGGRGDRDQGTPDAAATGGDAGAGDAGGPGTQGSADGLSGGPDGVAADDAAAVHGGPVTEDDQPAPDPESLPTATGGSDFAPTGVDDLAPAGKVAKLAANMEALRTLRRLQAEDRAATPEEQATLARWAGWGGLPDVFDPDKPQFADQRAELQTLLSETEIREARRNTLNAHYTDARVVENVWRAVEGLGFDGGRVLEPGSGSGTFIGFAPDNAEMVGVELDSTTAAISQFLYPSATIRNESFAKTNVPDGSFDATIGNVPFGDFPLTDRRHNPSGESIHNHFILKSLALTRPGGIVAVLTSRHTLDSMSPRAREMMAERADLIGAVRLPTGSHERASGTSVIEDILIFRVREPGQEPQTDQSWLTSTKQDIDGYRLPVSDYFTAHPENVLGDLAGSSRFGGDLVVRGDRDMPDLPGVLDGIVAEARADGLTATPRRADDPLADFIAPDASRHEGHIRAEEDGTFTQAVGGASQPLKVPAKQAEELRQLVGMRDALTSLLSAEAANAEDTPQIGALRANLNRRYDAYVEKFGPVNRYSITKAGARNPPGQGGFRDDPMAAVVSALETYDPTTQTAVKADLFTKRAVAPRPIRTTADNPQDALALSMENHGAVSLPAIAAMLGTDEATAREQLGTLVFEQPSLTPEEQAAAEVALSAERVGDLAAADAVDLSTVRESVRAEGGLEPAAAYLSGNVRRKLAAARAAATHDPRFQANVAALEAVIPVDLGPAEIDGRLGSAWIDPDTVAEFMREILNARYGSRSNQVQVARSGDIWTVIGPRQGMLATSEWGTPDRPAPELIQALLEQREIKVTRTVRDERGNERNVADATATLAAQAKAEELQERFSAWLWENPDRARRLQVVYNDRFNSIVLRQYPPTPDRVFPGMSEDWARKMLPHVKGSAERIVQEPTVLLAHVVGAGKTAAMVTGSQELRRLGLARKPAIVIPNHMLEQFSREYLEIYPQAKILAAGKEDLTGDKRREFVARAATGDWDAVILTRGAFEAMPMSSEQVQAYIDREMEVLRRQLADAQGGPAQNQAEKRTVKKMEKAILRAEEALKKKLDKVKDVGVSFEQTGIDYLMVDEAHDYSNLRTLSRIQGAGAKGSDRATDLHMKMEYLRANSPSGRVATFASGTPIRNTVTQAYVMQRFLRPDLLTDAGIDSFDQWAGTFGEVVEEMELKPEGRGFRQSRRFARFRNVPEFLRMFHTAADVKMAEDLNLETPDIAGGKPETVVVPASEALRAYVWNLGDRAEAVRAGTVEPTEDNMLKISGDGRKAALSMALVGGDHEPGKVEAAADRIAAIYERNKDRTYGDDELPGALQIVFADMGTPKAKGKPKKDDAQSIDDSDYGWNAYDTLKAELVARGMDPDSIRYIHEAKNDAQKAEMFAAARNGRISVLIGSSEKMGVGTNIQRRAVALHHLDAPWRPADVEQREGRIVRQKNLNPEVEVIRYVTEHSFDAYMWQTLERKAKFIAQVTRGSLDVREIEDVGDTALGFAEAKALATGNPDLLDKAKTDTALSKLERLERAHARSQTNMRAETARYEQAIPLWAADADAYDAAIARRVDTRGEQFAARVLDERYTKRPEAAEALLTALRGVVSRDGYAYNAPERVIGNIGGHDVVAQVGYGGSRGRLLNVRFAGVPGDIISISPHDLDTLGNGVISRLENGLDAFEAKRDRLRTAIEAGRDEIDRMAQRIGGEFPRAAELAALRAKAKRLAEKMERDAQRAAGKDVPFDAAIDTAANDDPALADPNALPPPEATVTALPPAAPTVAEVAEMRAQAVAEALARPAPEPVPERVAAQVVDVAEIQAQALAAAGLDPDRWAVRGNYFASSIGALQAGDVIYTEGDGTEARPVALPIAPGGSGVLPSYANVPRTVERVDIADDGTATVHFTDGTSTGPEGGDRSGALYRPREPVFAVPGERAAATVVPATGAPYDPQGDPEGRTQTERHVVDTLPDGSTVVIDPNRAYVPGDGYASNMRWALLDANGEEVTRGPEWRVRAAAQGRRALTDARATPEPDRAAPEVGPGVVDRAQQAIVAGALSATDTAQWDTRAMTNANRRESASVALTAADASLRDGQYADAARHLRDAAAQMSVRGGGRMAADTAGKLRRHADRLDAMPTAAAPAAEPEPAPQASATTVETLFDTARNAVRGNLPAGSDWRTAFNDVLKVVQRRVNEGDTDSALALLDRAAASYRPQGGPEAPLVLGALDDLRDAITAPGEAPDDADSPEGILRRRDAALADEIGAFRVQMEMADTLAEREAVGARWAAPDGIADRIDTLVDRLYDQRTTGADAEALDSLRSRLDEEVQRFNPDTLTAEQRESRREMAAADDFDLRAWMDKVDAGRADESDRALLLAEYERRDLDEYGFPRLREDEPRGWAARLEQMSRTPADDALARSGDYEAIRARLVELGVTIHPALPSPDQLALALKTAAGQAVHVRVGNRSYIWKPGQHPRDRHGKFISIGGEVRTAAGEIAKVANIVDANHVEVQKADGGKQVVNRHDVTVTKGPGGKSPTSRVEHVAEQTGTGKGSSTDRTIVQHHEGWTGTVTGGHGTDVQVQRHDTGKAETVQSSALHHVGHEAAAAPHPIHDADVGTLDDHALVAGLHGAPTPDVQQRLDAELTDRANKQAAALIERVHAVEGTMTPLLHGIADDLGMKMRGLGEDGDDDFRFKTASSLTRKIKTKAIEKGKTTDQVAGGINDALRYTMQADADNFADSVQGVFDRLTAEGYSVKEADNSWVEGNTYKGINAVLVAPDGSEVEVQFHTPESFDLKNGELHAHYETMRDPSKSYAERQAAYLACVDLSAQLSTPPGVEEVGDLKRYGAPTPPSGSGGAKPPKVLDLPVTDFGMTYHPSDATDPSVVIGKQWGGWDDLPTTDFDLKNTPLHATEEMLASSSVNKVVSGQVPLREGYDPHILIRADGTAVVIDGHHRVAMHAGLRLDTMRAKVYDERTQPPIGRLAAVPEDVSAALDTIKADGRPDGTGTEDDPIFVGDDLDRAIALLAEGKHVRLAQPEQVATLVERLSEEADRLAVEGKEAPEFDLCKVSVPGTNLFCADHRGVDRIEMPQFSGQAVPGSPAAAIANEKGKADVSAAFRAELKRRGISITHQTVPASHLRASQRQLNGAKIGSMALALDAGDLPPGSIFVTRDGYVIDGHHRWAANVAVDVRDNRLGDSEMPVEVVDMDIGTALDFANEFTRRMGIKSKGITRAEGGFADMPAAPAPAAPERPDPNHAALAQWRGQRGDAGPHVVSVGQERYSFDDRRAATGFMDDVERANPGARMRYEGGGTGGDPATAAAIETPWAGGPDDTTPIAVSGDGPVSVTDAQRAAQIVGDFAAQTILGPGGLSGADDQAMRRLVAAANRLLAERR